MSATNPGKWPCVMIDIETLGTSDDAVILELGAVVFDRKKRIVGEGFERTLDYLDQGDRRTDLETVMWWTAPERMERFREIQDGHERKPGLWHGLTELESFLKRYLAPEGEVWAKGDFDLRILKHAFQQNDLTEPWEYWQARELRTVMKWLGVKAAGAVPHRAVQDARLQVETLFECERRIPRWNVNHEAGWRAYRTELAERRAMLLPGWAELDDEVRDAFVEGVDAALWGDPLVEEVAS